MVDVKLQSRHVIFPAARFSCSVNGCRENDPRLHYATNSQKHLLYYHATSNFSSQLSCAHIITRCGHGHDANCKRFVASQVSQASNTASVLTLT